MTYTQTKTRRQFGKFLSPIGCNHNYQSALKNLCAVLNIRRAYFSAHLVNSYCTVSQKNIDSQAHALFRLGFPSLTPSGLGLHAIITRWLIIQNFTPPSGFFSPFPHGTCSLSVNQEYLALEEGPPMFKPNFTCTALLLNQETSFRIQGYHLLSLCFPPHFAN